MQRESKGGLQSHIGRTIFNKRLVEGKEQFGNTTTSSKQLKLSTFGEIVSTEKVFCPPLVLSLDHIKPSFSLI